MDVSSFVRPALAAGLLAILFACHTPERVSEDATQLPNIVLIYVDDLGYGDLGCYGAKGVSTPNVDRLARNGLKFTGAHCAAATCTPSRYALLTGRHAFRKKAAVLPGDAPLLIDTQRPTLASMLKKAGYATAVVGKWHLGLGNGAVNWNTEIRPGPLELGFDHCFLIPATGDRVPTVYVEDHRVVNLRPNDPIVVSYKNPVGNRPTGESHPELLRFTADAQHNKTIVNGVSRIGYMQGGEAALWVDEEFPDVLNNKAKAFINKNKDRPFFLYYAYPDIHVPRLPNARFQAKSTMGVRGDAIVQMDWMTGEIARELEKLGLAQNTLILFTSDNGPVLNDGYADEAEKKLGAHRPVGPFRGGKYSAYEAGTRVPTIAYWPGQIRPGESDALLSQLDFYASLASLTGQPLGKEEAIDSENYLQAWLGRSIDGRRELVEESISLSLRDGSWKYIRPVKKGNYDWVAQKNIEGGFQYTAQLYNLEKDVGERHNIAEQHPEKVAAMEQRLQEIVQRAERTELDAGEKEAEK